MASANGRDGRAGDGDVVLDNGVLRVVLARHGAELASLRRHDWPGEYLWQGDPAWWERRAPLLFPIVGRLRDDTATWRGRSVRLGQHGFARDCAFDLADRDAATATFILHESAATLACYPFPFHLAVTHALAGDALRVAYEVTNPGDGELPFSLGAHPGFRCPLVEGDTLADHAVEFETAETACRFPVVGGLVARAGEPILDGSRILPLDEALFARGGVVFRTLASRRATLVSRRSGRGVEVAFPDFPYFALWTKPGAPFVCLEPWCGVADPPDASGRLEDKEGLVRLPPGGTFRRTVTIRPS